MALNSLGLGITFTARDAMSGVLYRLQRAFSGVQMTSQAAVAVIGAGFASMAAGIGVFAAGLGQLEASFNMASASSRFEADITRAGLIAGAAGKDLLALRDAALDASQSSGFEPHEVTKGLQDIAAMGFTAQQSIQMLRPALDLAAAGGIGVASAAEAMSSAIKVFGLQSTDARATADKLVAISNNTALQAGDLEIALGTVGRGAAAAKQNLDEMLISMGLVKNTGVDATVAASSVSSALLFMAEKADAFKAIGVDVEDANGKFRNFLDVVMDVNAALADEKSDAKAVATVKGLFQRFGITAYQAISTQIKTGIFDEATGKTYKMAEAVDYLRGRMKAAAEDSTSTTFAEKMLLTYEGLMSRLTAGWEVFKITVGDGFKDFFKPLIALVVVGLEKLTNFIREIPDPVKKFGAALLVTSGIMTMAAGAAITMAGALAILGGAVILGGGPLLLWFAGVAAAAVPIALVAATLAGALTALGGVIYTVFTNNLGGATDRVVAEFNRWKLIFRSVIGFLTEGKLTGALAEEFMGADQRTQDFVVSTTLFFEKLKAGFVAFWDTFKYYLGQIMPAFDAVVASFGKITDALHLTDGAFHRLHGSFSKSDFESRGRGIAEILVTAFLAVAVVITMINDAIAFLIRNFERMATAAVSVIAGPLGPLLTIAQAVVPDGTIGGAISSLLGTATEPSMAPPPPPPPPNAPVGMSVPMSMSSPGVEQVAVQTTAAAPQPFDNKAVETIVEAIMRRAPGLDRNQAIRVFLDVNEVSDAVRKNWEEQSVMSFAAESGG